jgi:uncharacterized alpha-E superfamily protein
MLSRVADNLYWMSRYLERAENTAALIDEHLNLMLDSAPASSEERWSRVVASLGIIPFETPPRSVPHALAFGTGRRSSIVTCVASARDNARQVREQASSEMWEQLNRLYHSVRDASAQEQWRSDPQAFLKAVRDGAYLFQGITDSTMNHDQAWRFIQFGRYLERAGALITLLDVHFRSFEAEQQSQDLSIHLEWIGLLKSCSAFEAYCKVYTADVKAARVAEFLLLNDVFPHSLRFCLERIHAAVQAFPEGSRKATERLARLTGRLRSTLSFSDIGELMAGGLHTWLDSVLRQCHLIHIAVREAYIDYPIERAIGA